MQLMQCKQDLACGVIHRVVVRTQHKVAKHDCYKASSAKTPVSCFTRKDLYTRKTNHNQIPHSLKAYRTISVFVMHYGQSIHTAAVRKFLPITTVEPRPYWHS